MPAPNQTTTEIVPKRMKIEKELIDKLYREKRDLVKEAKRKTIAFAKIEVSNYGP